MFVFIVNPVAGNGFARKTADQIRTCLDEKGVEYRLVYTEYPGHATELAAGAAADQACEAVISVGGDGTAFEVASGLLDSAVPFGIIPAGTGNDFIKTVAIPRKPMDALEFILSHKPRPVDVGSMNDKLFLNVCGTGFDVTVLDYTLAAKKYFRGILPYLIGLVRGIFHHTPAHVRFTADGKTQEKDVLICAVANGRFIGGGIAICPDASADDGKFDLVVVEDRKRWQIPYYLPGLLLGKVLSFKITTHYRCSEVEIISKGMRLNVDGEILPLDKAVFRIQPGKLMLYW
ncbi:MAG: diacylglycerol kinase family lipid kinase [Clostridia bacterium]|nr:diacylglycerol kinase family lipid kinase [Clostridia bacterium]